MINKLTTSALAIALLASFDGTADPVVGKTLAPWQSERLMAHGIDIQKQLHPSFFRNLEFVTQPGRKVFNIEKLKSILSPLHTWFEDASQDTAEFVAIIKQVNKYMKLVDRKSPLSAQKMSKRHLDDGKFLGILELAEIEAFLDKKIGTDAANARFDIFEIADLLFDFKGADVFQVIETVTEDGKQVKKVTSITLKEFMRDYVMPEYKTMKAKRMDELRRKVSHLSFGDVPPLFGDGDKSWGTTKVCMVNYTDDNIALLRQFGEFYTFVWAFVANVQDRRSIMARFTSFDRPMLEEAKEDAVIAQRAVRADLQVTDIEDLGDQVSAAESDVDTDSELDAEVVEEDATSGPG